MILNDNKLSQISHRIGNLTNLNILLLHNNPIKEVPSTLYRLHLLEQFSLDWFCYLNTDFLPLQTKILKLDVPLPISDDELDLDDKEDSVREVMTKFFNLCKMYHISDFKRLIEAK